MRYSVIIIYLNFYDDHHRSYDTFTICNDYIEPHVTCSEQYKDANFSLASIEVHVNNQYFEI